MKYKHLDTVLSEAEDSWKKDHPNDEMKEYKVFFILGWLKSSYSSMWNDLPESKKENALKTN